MSRPQKPLIDEDGEVRELTDEDFAQALRFDQLSPDHQAMLRKVRGAQIAPTKVQISLRISHDVLEKFRATGTGWQARMDQVLREWVERAA